MDLNVRRIEWDTATSDELLFTLKAITLEIQSRDYTVPTYKY